MAQNAALAEDRLANLDFDVHNEEVKAVWDAYRAGNPIRVPVVVGTNTRYFLRDPRANPTGITFERYTEDPDTMFDAQLRFARWSRFNVLQDQELGLPDKWYVSVDFQNFHEAAWFGCPVVYLEGEVPDTLPAFAADPDRLMRQGIPDPFGNFMARAVEFEERLLELANGFEYMGRPVEVGAGSGLGTDGAFTAACNLFGPEFICAEILEDPKHAQELLGFITEAIGVRMAAWHKRWSLPERADGRWLADDSVALLSVKHYEEHVLPHHQRYFQQTGTGKGHCMHLCGNATRLFPLMVQELGIQSFDTGFPVDFTALRAQLGPDIEIQGGPHVEIVLNRTPQEIRLETQRVLESGIMEGGRFVLREGNNLAPHTPLENTEAMVLAGHELGRYRNAA